MLNFKSLNFNSGPEYSRLLSLEILSFEVFQVVDPLFRGPNSYKRHAFFRHLGSRLKSDFKGKIPAYSREFERKSR